MKRTTKLIGLAAVAAFAGIQFVPVSRANPPATGEIAAPAEVLSILKRSCYDCHSNATQWPWYGYVAPVSWLVARDVREGREELNFSQWESMTPGEKAESAENCVEQIARMKMPLPIYLPLHREARITPEQLKVLRDWAATFGTKRGGGEEHHRGERAEGRHREREDDDRDEGEK